MDTFTRWSGISGLSFDRSTSIDYPSPFLRFESFNLPSSIKSLFKLLSFAFMTDSNISPVIENISAYPITEVLITGHEDKKVIKIWEEIFNDILNIRVYSISLNLDYYLYGNAASTLYIPYTRYLNCNQCKTSYSLDRKDVQWSFKNVKWMLKCPSCKKETEAKAEDKVKRNDVNNFKLKKWNIYNLTFKKHPYSNKVLVEYEIPNEHAKKITSGDKEFIKETPLAIIEQVQLNYSGKGPLKLPLREEAVFVMQRNIPSMPEDTQSDWGLPLATAALRTMYFKTIMTRAQAAVLHEHIVPMRILYPVSPTGDPLDVPIGEWKTELLKEWRAWLKDPTKLVTTALPTQMIQLGGQGRALTLFAEIGETNREIIKSLNVPREFVEGGLQYSGSSVSLRMLENILLNNLKLQNSHLRWIMKKIALITNLPEVDIRFKPFKMADDLQQKSMYMNLWQANLISNKTICDMFDIDYEAEREVIKKEAPEKAKDQAESQATTQLEMQRLMESNAMPFPNAILGMGNPIPPQMVSQYVESLKTAPPEIIAQALEQIGQENPILAKYIGERLKLSPAEGLRIMQILQALPPQIQEKFLEDIRKHDPLAYNLYDLMKTNMPPAPEVDTRPNPEQKPPRREKKSI